MNKQPQITKYIDAYMRIDKDHLPLTENILADSNSDVDIVGVTFKPAGKIYYFYPDKLKCKDGDSVIVDTARGVEFAHVCFGNKTVPLRSITRLLPLSRVLRIATEQDILRHEENKRKRPEYMRICNREIRKHGLEMKLVDVETTFDNSKMLFYFSSEGRVDFRELVKDLAAIFHTRIELRQIGIRDEARLIGGISVCGRPLCCSTFLNDFAQVSIKMAKQQNLSLNSAKISGTCGRLMCCLRFENDAYVDAEKRTPKIDAMVQTPDGEGYVIDSTPLAGLVKVRLTGERVDEAVRVYHLDDITPLGGKFDRQNNRAVMPKNAINPTQTKPQSSTQTNKSEADGNHTEVPDNALQSGEARASNQEQTPNQGQLHGKTQVQSGDERRPRPGRRSRPNRAQNGAPAANNQPSDTAVNPEKPSAQQTGQTHGNNRRNNRVEHRQGSDGGTRSGNNGNTGKSLNSGANNRGNGTNTPNASSGSKNVTIPGMRPRDAHTISLIDGSSQGQKKPDGSEKNNAE